MGSTELGEAVKIMGAQRRGQCLMNLKSEFNRCKPPRLCVGDARVMLEEDKEEEIIKRMEKNIGEIKMNRKNEKTEVKRCKKKTRGEEWNRRRNRLKLNTEKT